MPPRLPVKTSDLRGAVRLATDATTGLTHVVEAMHARIARVPGFGQPAANGRTGGITGLVYRSVRGVTRVVGGSLDGLLALLGPVLARTDDAATPTLERTAVLAALNGVLGDHLAASGNPLATPMTFRRDGQPLVLDSAALATRLPDANGRLLVIVHGLCMSDLQWQRQGHDHGAALARDLGYTPVYLHYNSGQHISLNGRAFAQMLEQLTQAWPRPIERLVLLGHSMGGLVIRSAHHHGTAAGQGWTTQLNDMVFLGTPHRGAPLERAGNWVDVLLGATPYAAPLARLGQVRSAGITDLRHGNLVDADWQGRDRFARGADRRQILPLPEGVRCCTAAVTVGQAGNLKDRLLGDGLVPLDSALGRHRDAERTLRFAPERQWVGHGLNHLDLLSDAAVYQRLREWLA